MSLKIDHEYEVCQTEDQFELSKAQNKSKFWLILTKCCNLKPHLIFQFPTAYCSGAWAPSWVGFCWSWATPVPTGWAPGRRLGSRIHSATWDSGSSVSTSSDIRTISLITFFRDAIRFMDMNIGSSGRNFCQVRKKLENLCIQGLESRNSGGQVRNPMLEVRLEIQSLRSG